MFLLFSSVVHPRRWSATIAARPRARSGTSAGREAAGTHTGSVRRPRTKLRTSVGRRCPAAGLAHRSDGVASRPFPQEDPMIDVEQLGDVYVLHWHDNENRFNRKSLDALNAALDQVEAVEGPCALVTTGEGKYYSN